MFKKSIYLGCQNQVIYIEKDLFWGGTRMKNSSKKLIGFISVVSFIGAFFPRYIDKLFDGSERIHERLKGMMFDKSEYSKDSVLPTVKKTQNLRGSQKTKYPSTALTPSEIPEVINGTLNYKCETIPGTNNEGKIESPDFLVWDNWGFIENEGTQHVYAQYCNRSTCKVNEDKYWNARIRHFISENNGESWEDCGTSIDVSPNSSAFDSGIIWSGSTLLLNDGRVISAYTGVKMKAPNSTLADKEHYTLQSIGLGVSKDGGYTFEKLNRAIISAVESYKDFKEKGYYLGAKKTLGIDKDPDGIFMTLRDPFLFQKADGSLHVFFAAKSSHAKDGEKAVVPCVGHAVIKDVVNFEQIELLKPILLSSEKGFNQIECPNLVERNGRYYFIISTTQNNDKGEEDRFMDKTVRVYTSDNIDGGWGPYGKNGSHVILHNKKDNMYGFNILNEVKESNIIKGRVFIVDQSFIPKTVYLKVGGSEPVFSKKEPSKVRNRTVNLRRKLNTSQAFEKIM